MKISLYIIIILISCATLTTICFSADQWGAYLDERAKEEGIENPEWIKSLGIIIFRLLTAGVVFISISGYGNSVSLYSIRGVSGTIIALSYLAFSFLYNETFIKIWEYLIKGLAIVIGVVVIIILLSSIFSRQKAR
ncbi:MAG: hypothetical protein WA240_08450 [Nitrospirota bacterium]